MSALSPSIRNAAAIVVLVCAVSPAHGTGLYLDLPAYFAPVDTTKLAVAIGHTALRHAEGDASVVSAAVSIRPRPRAQVGLGLLYPAMERGGWVSHAVGDGIIHGTYRLAGDTLNISGIFLRGYGRVPLGPKRMDPFSYGSLDGGAGFEFRLKTQLFYLRCAQTFTLVGERRKPEPTAPADSVTEPFAAAAQRGDAPYFTHRNFFLFAVSIDFDLRSSTRLGFNVFSFRFRGGDAYEAYLFTVHQRLAEQLDLCLSAGIEAGEDGERVFDSLFSLSFAYRFPSPRPEPVVNNE